MVYSGSGKRRVTIYLKYIQNTKRVREISINDYINILYAESQNQTNYNNLISTEVYNEGKLMFMRNYNLSNGVITEMHVKKLKYPHYDRC